MFSQHYHVFHISLRYLEHSSNLYFVNFIELEMYWLKDLDSFSISKLFSSCRPVSDGVLFMNSTEFGATKVRDKFGRACWSCCIICDVGAQINLWLERHWFIRRSTHMPNGPNLKADFQSSHEAPRSSLRVMHEHFHPITMLNSSF
jgi:hypothetical protein